MTTNNNQVGLTNFKRILVIGNINVGKSTLINALVSQYVCKTSSSVCTKCEQTVNHKFDSFEFNLIDTPGANNVQNVNCASRALSSIHHSVDLLIYVGDCQYVGTTDELSLLTYIYHTANAPVVFALNKLDLFDEQKESITDTLEIFKSMIHCAGFKSPPIIPISAYAAYLFTQNFENLDKYTKREYQAYDNCFKRPYYILPHYVNDKALIESNVGRTGIDLLINTLIQL